MLRTGTLTTVIVLCAFLPLSFLLSQTGRSSSVIRRITHTSDEVINLNPSLSGDGRLVVFESSADLAGIGGSPGFHALRASLDAETSSFSEFGKTRVVAPGVSQDGSAIVFSSTEDLVGQNGDRNPEIFLHTGTQLRQVTNSSPSSVSTRLSEGSFQPSITDDGRFLVFSANRNLVGHNGDLNFELFMFETRSQTLTQITDTSAIQGATDVKISGDGSHLVFINDRGNVPGLIRDLLLYDVATGAIQTIAAEARGLTLTYGRAISDNGLKVVYSIELRQDESQVFLFDSTTASSRQITALATRVSEVSLNPTISGDGKRISFATRRRVIAPSDGSVELYIFDIPTGGFIQLTEAPPSATAEVVSSLNDDGSLVAFNFPRVLADRVADNDVANNCEIFVASVPPRPPFAPLTVLNGASLLNETMALPIGGIVIAQGSALANVARHGTPTNGGDFPFSLAASTVTVNGLPAQILYVSPTQVNFVIPVEAHSGPATIVITNAESFQSRTNALISNSAPGIFTTSGDGKGKGVVLDADTLLAGPFDPTSGRLRLAVFATGVRNAASVSCMISGRTVPVETYVPSPDLPGLDQIHLLIPASLRGAGEVDLIVTADGLESNTVKVLLSGSAVRDIVINEILADPPDGLAGDANHDGVRSSSDDEFVELVNSTTRDLDLTGYQLQTRTLNSSMDVVRHRFPAGTTIAAGTALVVFGGGIPDSSDAVFAGAKIFKASTGGISLSNAGGAVTVVDSLGSIVTSAQFGIDAAANDNQSLTRFPDITGSLVLHTFASGSQHRAYSPGTRVSGSPFPPSPAVSRIDLSPASGSLLLDETLLFSARALDEDNNDLSGVIFNWESSDISVATTDQNGLVRGTGPGTALLVASARGLRSSPSIVVVSLPSPSPTPTPLPSPSPSPSVIPSPSPTPSVSPGPSPSPSPMSTVVISQVYGGGGNSGAQFRNDFIEIRNIGNAAVDLSGWSVQYAGATSTTWSVTNLTSLSLAPGQYYLIREGSGGSSGETVPSPDASGTINLAATAGKVALVNTQTALVGACPSSNAIVDLLGYGTSANCVEGAGPAPAPSNSLALLRKANGCLDTQSNGSDFVAGTPAPRNSATDFSPCEAQVRLGSIEAALTQVVVGTKFASVLISVFSARQGRSPRLLRNFVVKWGTQLVENRTT